MSAGKPGVLHGNKTYLIQDSAGQIKEAHSISAGLDYPGIGPEHSWLKDTGRVKYVYETDEAAFETFKLLCRTEGILPAFEPSFSTSYAIKLAKKMSKDDIIVTSVCGRGDKDLDTAVKLLGDSLG